MKIKKKKKKKKKNAEKQTKIKIKKVYKSMKNKSDNYKLTFDPIRDSGGSHTFRPAAEIERVSDAQ